MNGANLLIECLKAHQVTSLFGYPGGAIMPVYDALYESGLDHLLCRNEQGAAMAAIGYARASGKVGVCLATSGPGATNVITGLADALLDSIPIVAITGQVASDVIGTDAFQEIDVLGLSLACTKHSFIVQHVEELPHIMAQAFQIAQSGRPGPVLVDIPKDIQVADTLATPLVYSLEPKPAYDRDHLEQAKLLIKQAKRPVLYVGGGVGMAKAVSALRQFLQVTQLPCVSTLKGLGSILPDTPYYMGMIGMHGTKAANYAVQQSDLLIVFGARFDDRVTGKLEGFAPHAKVIHADIDVAELNKLRQVDVQLCGDFCEILTALSTALKPSLDIESWQQEIVRLKQRFDFQYETNEGRQEIDPLVLLHQLSQLKSTKAIIATDVGQHQMWVAQHMDHIAPENMLTSAGLGTMGFGLPAAIGAKKASPESDVILISGDGSFMMNVQELGSIKRANLAIKIVLLDNQRLGMVRQWQSLFFQGRHSETILEDNPDFVTLATAFGITSEMIDRAEDVEDALKRMLNHAGAYLLHVCIPDHENVWPLVPPGASNQDMMEKIGE